VNESVLFDSFERSDATPGRHTESTFDFLNRVRSERWERVRCELDRWFAQYPTNQRADLWARFRSSSPRQHWPAWWELYLFRLFGCLGYEVEVHPNLVGSSARPDFRVRRGPSTFFVEALTVFSGIVDEGRNEHREAWILDMINGVQSSTFSVSIDFDQVGDQPPRRSEIIPKIEAWLAPLDPDRVADALAAGDDPPPLRLSVRDWVICLEAFPISPEYRDEPPGPLIGSGPMSGGPVDDVDRLRGRLKEKCARYPPLEEPLVLAVLSMSTFAGAATFEQALLGSHGIQYSRGKAGVARQVRLPDGVWMSGRGATGTHVSAAITASHLEPSQVCKGLPRLWRNPWTERALDEDIPLPLAVVSTDGRVDLMPGTISPADVLRLPAEWPDVVA
jgi:hypothetical protein